MNKFIVFPGNNSRVFLIPALLNRGNWSQASQEEVEQLHAQFIWKPTVLSIRSYNKLDTMYANGFGPMIHNHLQNNRFITTKTGLIRALRKYYACNQAAVYSGYSVYESIPTSFILTAHSQDWEYRKFVARFTQLAMGISSKETMPEKHCQQNMWLVKPAALNQGKGIQVCRSLNEIKNMLKGKPLHSLWVVQKYIQKPLLFKGRKFDIRIWALATASHEFFYYRIGYLRTSSSEYDTQASNNYIHLTNNCLQKFGQNYGAFQEGNTLGFGDFQQYLDSDFKHLKLNFWTHLLPRMKDLMIDSYLSGQKFIQKGKRPLVFELLGFDFMIDEDFRVWLIQVNTNPYLGVPNDYMGGVLPKMIDQMLAIVLDPYITPELPRLNPSQDFELLYCQFGSLFSKQPINARQQFNTPIYVKKKLAQPKRKLIRAPKKFEKKEKTVERVSSRIVFKDTYQTLKEMFDNYHVLQIHQFEQISSMIMSHLNNWELLSEEQVNSSIKALKLLISTHGSGALVSFNHCQSLVNLCKSENLPVDLQAGILDALGMGCHDTKFHKEIVQLGICQNLVTAALSESSFKSVAIKGLQIISKHSTKKFYIPGETREHNWIRQRIQGQGVLVALYFLSKQDSEFQEEIRKHIQEEFTLHDWETLLYILERVLQKRNPTKNRRDSIQQYIKFPEVLRGSSFLTEIFIQVSDKVGLIKREIQQKISKDRQRKELEKQERIKIEEQQSREIEYKKIKVQEYAIQRYQAIRKQKILQEKKNYEIKQANERFNEVKKAILLEKAKKNEEVKRLQRLQKKQEELNQKKRHQQIFKQKEETRKRAVDEWLRRKSESERERRKKEMQRKQDQEKHRLLVLQQRRTELLAKLEERKTRKIQQKRCIFQQSTAKLPQTAISKSPSNNIIRSKHHSPRNPIPKSPKTAWKPIKSSMERFLVQVYKKKSNHPRNMRKDYKKRCLSKTETQRLGKLLPWVEEATSSKFSSHLPKFSQTHCESLLNN